MTFFLNDQTKFHKWVSPFHVSSFMSYGSHFPSFWIFPIACKRLEIVPWWSTPNAFANSSKVWVESSSSNACNSASLNFSGGFPRSLLLRSKSPLLKRRNQSVHVVSDEAYFTINFHKNTMTFSSGFLPNKIIE